MASAFGHALTAVAIGSGYSRHITNMKFWILGITCSVLPDGDTLGFLLGIYYGSFWGHRGFSHSILFALITGIFATIVFFGKRLNPKACMAHIIYFSTCTLSHGILDAMTTGGLGVAFFSPWDQSRYFLPWRPIHVSPIGVSEFFSEWGKRVILNEIIWIGLPCIAYILGTRFTTTNKTPNE